MGQPGDVAVLNGTPVDAGGAGYLDEDAFEPASAGGAERLVDTRTGWLAEPAPVGTTPTTSTTTTIAGTPVQPPSAPRQIAVEPGPGQVTLMWVPPIDDGGAPVDRYRVERAPAGSDDSVVVYVVEETTYTDTHLPDAEYVYRIAAHNAAGWGPASTGVVARPGDPLPPGPPFGLRAKTTANSATLSWQSPMFDGGAPVAFIVARYDCGTPAGPLAQVLVHGHPGGVRRPPRLGGQGSPGGRDLRGGSVRARGSLPGAGRRVLLREHRRRHRRR